MNKFSFSLLFSFMLFFACDDAISPDDTSTSSINWKGLLPQAPLNPELNWVYYDTFQEVTFIYNGTTWDTMSVSGIDASPIIWLGSFPVAPPTPKEQSVYYNSVDKISYIFSDGVWDTLSCSGENGMGLVWKGTLESAPEKPELNWIYNNSVDQCSYIFNGTDWELFSTDGLNGKGIIWKGTLKEAPELPQDNWAYYNSVLRCSYIYSADEWQILSKDGAQGTSGSIIEWKGTHPEHPEDAMDYWAYQNSTDGCTYIFHDLRWNILSMAGYDGIGIIWIGKLLEHPANPAINWGYYNVTTGISYIFNGTQWDVLCCDGAIGNDGIALIWQGTHAQHPLYAKINWAYHNSSIGQSFIFTGVTWRILGKDGNDGKDGKNGKDGKDGESTKENVHQLSDFVNSGDTLTLNYSKNSKFSDDNCGYTANYMVPESGKVFPYVIVDSNWKGVLPGDPPKIILKRIAPYTVSMINNTNQRLFFSLTVHNSSRCRETLQLYSLTGGAQ